MDRRLNRLAARPARETTDRGFTTCHSTPRRPSSTAGERYGVSRQTVHVWIRRYRAGGLAGLADRSHRPHHHPWRLDADAMQSGAQSLLGRHDFTTFRAAECQAKSPIKTLDRLDVEREGDAIRVFASARSFLHHQVRSMVGTLMLVGAGRWSADDVSAALDAKDRARCGPTAPAGGLTLVRVDYPEEEAPGLSK